MKHRELWFAKIPRASIHLPLMRLFRSILCTLLALLWWPVTNSCLVASSFPELMAVACECGTEHEENNGPYGTKDCPSCATLESGVNLAALQQPVVPPVMWTVTDSLVELLEKLARLESQVRLRQPPIPPIPPPVWRHDVTRAQPVRGPSLEA